MVESSVFQEGYWRVHIIRATAWHFTDLSWKYRPHCGIEGVPSPKAGFSMISPPQEIRLEQNGPEKIVDCKAIYSNNGLFGKGHLNNRCNNLWTLREKPVKCPMFRLHFPVCSQFALPSTTTNKNDASFGNVAAKAQDNTSWTEASGNCTCRVSPCRKLTHPEIKVGQLTATNTAGGFGFCFEQVHNPKQNERLEFLIMKFLVLKNNVPFAIWWFS